MTVNIFTCTDRPIDVISLAAGCCYGKEDVSEKRVVNCISSGHESVLEHAGATFMVTDISRACSHQLVRHRVASYSQKSQRYTKLSTRNLSGRDWYVVPPDILDGTATMEAWDYHANMHAMLINYLGAIEGGLKPEDARYLLPEAVKTDIVCTMNLREVKHFVDLRGTKNAQWEIRQVAFDLVKALYEHDSQWKELIKWIFPNNYNTMVSMGADLGNVTKPLK